MRSLGLALTLLAASCLCDDRREGSSVSPDGKYMATWTIRNCGATTPYITRIELSRRGLIPVGRTKLVLVLKGSPDVTFTWKTATELEVSVARNEGLVYELQRRAFDVQLTYVGIPVSS